MMPDKTEIKKMRDALCLMHSDHPFEVFSDEEIATWARLVEPYMGDIGKALLEKLERLENESYPWRTDFENAPKDGTPILCWTNRDADPFTLDGGKTLTTFATHCEFSDIHQPLYDGQHICEFGGEYFESSCGNRDYEINVKDYWFIYGTDFTYLVNPTHWQPLPKKRDK